MGERTYKVSKTREGQPKIRLYESGQVMLERVVASTLAGQRLGVAWKASGGAA